MEKACGVFNLFAIFVFLAFSFIVFGCASQSPAISFGVFGSAHEHADFKLYINNIQFNFSQGKFMEPLPPSGIDSECGNDSRLAHLHDMDGDVVHKHATGVTWGYFFSTLNISLANNCLALDNGSSYCNNQNSKWQYFANGTEISDISNFEIHDLDRALITYGASASQVSEQLASVTSKAALEEKGSVCGIQAPEN